MNLTRRNFLKLSGLSAIGAFLGSISLLSGCKSKNKLKGTKQTFSICPFCSVGCGLIVSAREGRIVNIEGDPDHPINKGKLCAKGSAAFQLSGVNDKRLTMVNYRAPYAAAWQEITWEEALKKIAGNIKKTRDTTFIEYEGKDTVNRTAGLAVFAGSMLNNEEYYLLSKMARLLGIAYLGNESDLSHSATNAALSNTLGYGAMTNHWIDLQHSDAILIIGANPAENHPVSAGFILKAKEKGGKIIHVDPRFTRTSSAADYYCPLRPGTDIAFTGGMINYALQNNRIQKEYILEYTNAAYIVNPEYKFQDGFFNGFRAGKYNSGAWDYEKDKKGIPRMDKTLKSGNTVFQIMKNHFSRYTPETVSRVTGCPAETFLKIADIFTSTYGPEKAGAVLYSSGATQHAAGTQNVRAYAILQLLLGNIGVLGGGLNAIRNGSNDQGSADHLHSNYLPGYLPAPVTGEHSNLDSYIKDTTPLTNDAMSINILSRRNSQIINMLKAFYGNTAAKENDYCFHWLPKIEKPYYQKAIYDDIQKGIIKAAFFAGANPMISAPDTNSKAKALENLEWMVVSDIFETETPAFWKRPGANPEKIKTEVFLLPSASALEKDGSLSNSGRWAQWRYKAANPPGRAKSDLWIFDKIFKETKKLYAGDKDAIFPDSIEHANWDYAGEGDEADPQIVAREINGFDWKTKKLADSFNKLRDDGSTAAGNWLYCGSFTEEGNMMARRVLKDASRKGLHHEWAWTWPDNARILYNRASVNRKGSPWSPEKWLMKWDDKWKGDNVNGEETSGPADKNPFIVLTEGVARIFAKDFADGPLPEHYEPLESPVANMLNQAGFNPANMSAAWFNQPGSNITYPYIATAYNIAEAWQAGQTGRNLPWLAELGPDNILCEISTSLAASKGIKSGDKALIQSRRGRISAYCLVTERIQPFLINGRKIEMIGIVMNSGRGNIQDNINQLTHDFGDANTDVPEYKAFLVNIGREA